MLSQRENINTTIIIILVTILIFALVFPLFKNVHNKKVYLFLIFVSIFIFSSIQGAFATPTFLNEQTIEPAFEFFQQTAYINSESDKIFSIKNDSNKKILKVDIQEKIKTKKTLKKLEKNIDFNKTYKHARNIGFTNLLNDSLIVSYNDGTNVTFIALASENNSAIFLAHYQFLETKCEGKKEKTFLMNLKKVNDSMILLMFDDEGGLEIDLTKMKTLSSWGHHSCFWSSCIQYCWDFVAEEYPTYFNDICMAPCKLCAPSLSGFMINPYVGAGYFIATCGQCLACTSSIGITCTGTCTYDSCYFYPCQY